MNEADKKAFKDWWGKHETGRYDDQHKAWQAALEYRDKQAGEPEKVEPSEDAKRTLNNPPERIYLQVGDSESDFPGEISWRDVTWCDEQCERNDLMYIRSDIAQPAPLVRLTQEELENLLPSYGLTAELATFADKVMSAMQAKAQPAPDTKELRLFKLLHDQWIEKTDWVQERQNWPFPVLGSHRADVMRQYIEHLESLTDVRELVETFSDKNHPIQPFVTDKHGVVRFKENKIVSFLADGKLNDLATMDFPRKDWVQLAQLIGYSISGWGYLSYVKDKDWERVQAALAKHAKRGV